MSTPPASPRRRFSPLDLVERVGNGLPNPATMIVLLAVATLIASWVAAKLGVQVPHPKDGTPILAVNLLDAAGVRRMFLEAVKNFTGFAPLGTVLVAMLGIGMAEGTGFVGVSLRAFVMSVPRSWRASRRRPSTPPGSCPATTCRCWATGSSSPPRRPC